MHKIGGAVAVLALFVGAGCGTTYAPRPGPRIAEVSGGYLRDGRLYSHAAFGGGLPSAVEGNPEAEKHARSFRKLSLAGFVLDLTGAGLCGAGGGTLGTGSGGAVIGIVFLNLGVSLVLTGAILGTVAVPHKIDAINIYNDGVESKPLAPRREASIDVLLR